MTSIASLRRFIWLLLLSASAAWCGGDLLAQGSPPPKLAPVLQPYVDSRTLAGAVVLVADKDKVLDVEAVGWADIAAKKPMQTDSVFWIASQSKPITGAALMILVDEGRVNVDDPVEKYLPEFKGQQVDAGADPAKPELKAPRHPILVREVLSHTSGLPFKTNIEEPTLDARSLEERVKSYAKTPLLFEPGTKSKYSNAGINTAGRIVEVVSGMSFEKFLDERIFKPLGMTDTTFHPVKGQIARLAKSYKPNAAKDGLEETTISQLKYPLDDPERRAMPAGGLFSTANDLSLFYRMMANGGVLHGRRILSEKAVQTATSDQSGEAKSNYGFGFGTDGKSFTHGGAYGTNSRYDKERNLVTVYLVQHAGWSGNGKDILPAFQRAASEAFGAKVAAPARGDALPVTVGISSAPEAKANAAGPAAAAKYEPPAIKPEDILPGTTKQFTFTQSRIFPGTTREVTVFIPAQYDGRKPACVYVKTDGFNPREKTLLETAIATKEMPVTVGVFVRPGEVPAPMKGTIGRRNRDFEYDGVSDNHVRFLVDELLPFVAKEYGLDLSTNGNDRCMVGGSSGGIAAFTAAWHRPEAFSRVYAASGSWVAFRGGHEFPTLVRKFEAKPIRAYLTTATRDMENCAGDWFLADQEMDKALKFSGYDYQFRTIDGRHVAGYGENWQEAMAYLWKGWPARVKAGPSAPRAREIIIPGEDWQLVAEGFKSTRGPSCNARGEVFFADTTAGKIHRIGLDGKVSEFAADTGAAHCATVGADGSLFTISEKSGKLMRYDTAGNRSVVMEGITGHSILARPDGGLYVTDNDDKKPNNGGSVWFIKDGKKTRVDSGLKFATGIAYRPDQWLVSVAEGHSKWVCSYQVNDDGTLTHKERFFHLHVADWDDDAGAESLCYSLEGRQFIATKSGVQISADDGPTQVILPVPERARVTGVAIGGPAQDTLFAFCGNKIWKRKIQQHAMGAFTPWTKVGGTKL